MKFNQVKSLKTGNFLSNLLSLTNSEKLQEFFSVDIGICFRISESTGCQIDSYSKWIMKLDRKKTAYIPLFFPWYPQGGGLLECHGSGWFSDLQFPTFSRCLELHGRF